MMCLAFGAGIDQLERLFSSLMAGKPAVINQNRRMKRHNRLAFGRRLNQ